ncbi:hypothetical protein [Polycladidibacter stylochi]|uniref:hypothetical protein n=1 Tax=Polycladidibacter stylochi TaxID=1807766 RepID=UPI0008297AAB|nr:hypothetical protein [Pseudovibrio stylochi]
MNKPMIAAALTLIITALIHAVAGGPQYLNLILQADIPIQNANEQKALYAVIWHAITVLFTVNGLALLTTVYLNKSAVTLGWTCIVQLLCFSALFIILGFSWLGEIMSLPQWILFGFNICLLLWGINVERKQIPSAGAKASKSAALS